MLTQILNHLDKISDMPIQSVVKLGGWTIYLFLSPTLNIWNLREYIVSFWANINKRRLAMKQFALKLSLWVIILTAPLFNGCYTSFRAVRHYSPSDLIGQETVSYDNLDEESYYYPEDSYESYEVTELQLRPSGYRVEKTYYSYTDYVREIHYVRGNPYPWIYPAYYDHIYDGWTFNINFSYNPWYGEYYYPGYWRILYPGYAWYEVWCGYPVYYPVPICCPVPIIYYPPVYYPAPYYGYTTHTKYEKREWERRQPQREPRGISRAPSNSSGRTQDSGNSSGRVVRRPDMTQASRSSGSIQRGSTRDRDLRTTTRTQPTRQKEITPLRSNRTEDSPSRNINRDQGEEKNIQRTQTTVQNRQSERKPIKQRNSSLQRDIQSQRQSTNNTRSSQSRQPEIAPVYSRPAPSQRSTSDREIQSQRQSNNYTSGY